MERKQCFVQLCPPGNAVKLNLNQPAQQAFPFGFGAKKDRGKGFSVLAARELVLDTRNSTETLAHNAG